MFVRRTIVAALGLAIIASLAPLGSALAFPPQGNNAQLQQLQRRVQQQLQQRLRQQQQMQQRLAQALRQRNQRLVQQYRDQAKKQQDAYNDELKKLRESGMTADDIRKMQRDSILAQLPRSQRSALERKWAREDRIRQRAIARAKAQGQPVPADTGQLDLGGLEGLQLD